MISRMLKYNHNHASSLFLSLQLLSYHTLEVSYITLVHLKHLDKGYLRIVSDDSKGHNSVAGYMKSYALGSRND